MNPRITRLWDQTGALGTVGVTYRKGGRYALVIIKRDPHHYLGGWLVSTGSYRAWVPTLRRAFNVGKLYASLRLIHGE